MKTKLEIKNRFTGNIIFEFETENNSIKKTVQEYIKQELASGKWCADLTHADLTDANLTHADLTDANLTHADLTHADLTHANLTDANLTHANLTRADLLRFKSDLWRVLLMYKNEIGGLKQSILDGKIDGSKYSGTCACLKGTIANVKGCEIDLLPNITKSTSEPSEQWFLQFKEGQTPSNSNALKLTFEWIEEFEMFLNSPTNKK
jgi:hypothetical protein